MGRRRGKPREVPVAAGRHKEELRFGAKTRKGDVVTSREREEGQAWKGERPSLVRSEDPLYASSAEQGEAARSFVDVRRRKNIKERNRPCQTRWGDQKTFYYGSVERSTQKRGRKSSSRPQEDRSSYPS